MKICFCTAYILFSIITFGQETFERKNTDSIIRKYCSICNNQEKRVYSQLEDMFHKSHISLGFVNDDQRLISIEKSIELAKLERQDRYLFFYIS